MFSKSLKPAPYCRVASASDVNCRANTLLLLPTPDEQLDAAKA